MIHEVRLPRETRQSLSQVVRAQMDLLWCAIHIETQFDRPAIKNCLTRLNERADRTDKLSTWLFAGRSKPRKFLQAFIDGQEAADFVQDGHSLIEEKQAVVRMMRQDVGRLYQLGRNATLAFYLVANVRNPENITYSRDIPATLQFLQEEGRLPDWLTAVQDFLIYFYDGLSSGLSGELFPTSHRYSRGQFLAAFENENPEQYVCAICDEHRNMTILRGKYFSDIEHYFPKSLYPHLSCHPYNLIPICKQCNQARLNRDPLLKSDGTRRMLGEIFLPYRSESVTRQGSVKFSWDSQKEKTTPCLEIRSHSTTPNATFDTKLQAFSEIYDIPGRWQERIHQIGEQLWRYIRHYVRVEIGEGQQINPIHLKSELEQLLGYLIDDLGKSPWTYVLVWYLANMLVEEIEAALQSTNTKSAIPVLETIRDVLQEQNASATARRLRAKEIVGIARKLYGDEPPAA